MQIQKTADNLKRATAQLEQQNKSLAGDMEQQRQQLSQQLFTAQQEADKVCYYHTAPNSFSELQTLKLTTNKSNSAVLLSLTCTAVNY